MRRLIPTWLRVSLAVGLFFLAVFLLAVVLQRTFAAVIPGEDLYVFWSAGRALQAGQNPYTPEVTAAIQMGIYGHTLQPGQDPMHFAYPPYSLFPIWPLLGLTFDWVEAFWLSFNLLLGGLVLRLTLPRAPAIFLPWIFFAYPFAFGLILGNFAILIAIILLFYLGRFWLQDQPSPHSPQAQAQNRLETRHGLESFVFGLLLAWTTGKPQLSWFFLLLVALRALRRREVPLLAGFTAGLMILLGLSFALLSDWPASWLSQLSAYARLNTARSPLEDYLAVILPSAWLHAALVAGWLILLAGSLVWLWRWRQGRLDPFFLLAWVGMVTFLVNPSGRAYDQLPYLIPMILSINRATLLQSPPDKTWQLAFGAAVLASILLSWTLFALSRGPFPAAADRWLFLFFLAWLAWFGSHTRSWRNFCAG